MFILKSLVSGTWSWGGFARSLLIGAITGAATGGLIGGMSATGFNGAVIIGSMNGGIAGGIDALFNGQNFFAGLYKGAVMGAAIGGVGYAINYFLSGSYKTKYFSKDSIYDNDGFTYDPSVSKETMQQNINTMRADNFTKEEIQQFGVGKDLIGTENIDSGGYLNPGNGKQYAYTLPKDFITGNSDIIYSPIAAQNKSLLALSMIHETGHAYFNLLGLKSMDIDWKGKISDRFLSSLNDTDHFAIYKLEAFSAAKNNMYTGPLNSVDRMRQFYERLIGTPAIKLIDNTYNKLFPIFNRVIK